MTTVQRIAKNTGALFIAQAVLSVAGLLLSIFVARTLGDVEFGKYSFVLAFTALFGVFITLGYGTLLVREVARDKSLAGKYFGNIVAIRVVLSVIIFAAMAITINLRSYPSDTKTLVYLFGIYVILISFANVCRFTFRAFEKMEYEAVTLILREVFRVALGIAALFLGYGLRGLVFAFLFSAVLDLLASFFLCGRKFVRPRIEIDLGFWKQTAKIVIPLSLLSIFGLIYTQIDIVILAEMKGDAVVGWYNAARNLATGLGPIPYLFMTALLPVMSNFFLSSKQSLKTTYEKSFKYLLILSFPITAGIILLADRFILLFYGQQFENSIVILQILAVHVLLSFLYQCLAFVLVSLDKQNQMAITGGAGVLINVILNLALIPRFSSAGAAIATLITEGVLFGVYFYLVSKHLYRLPLYKIIVRPLIACAVMVLIVYFFRGINLAAVISLAAVLYFIVLYLIKGISREDVGLLRQATKIAIKRASRAI